MFLVGSNHSKDFDVRLERGGRDAKKEKREIIMERGEERACEDTAKQQQAPDEC